MAAYLIKIGKRPFIIWGFSDFFATEKYQRTPLNVLYTLRFPCASVLTTIFKPPARCRFNFLPDKS